MTRSRITFTATILAILTVSSAAFAGGGNSTKQVIIGQKPGGSQTRQVIIGQQGGGSLVQPQQVIVDPGFGGQPVLAHFSQRLGARFEIQQIQIGNFAPVLAARIVSVPAAGSPLKQLGLDVGDVITRLDGNPVNNNAELDRHVYDTLVRFVRAGSNHVEQGTMYVQNQFFAEPIYTPHCGTQPGCPLRP